MPFVITAFVAGKISTGISANTLNGWRWGVSPVIPFLAAPSYL
jgi:hypothetical protein